MLENNQEAPFFRAVNQDNQLIYLSDYLQKKNVVVYFYPKDDTPGCTIEANEFTTLAPAFTELDTVILGVSKDSCESHRAFIKKFDLTIQLLADTEGTLCDLFDVWQEVEKDGVKKFKVVRSTFIIDKQGQIREALYNVSPEGHAQAVLEKINEISQQTNTA